MAGRRSKPLLIAPLIPAWAILGIFGSDALRGARFLIPFVILWTILGSVLFVYILRRLLAARRLRTER